MAGNIQSEDSNSPDVQADKEEFRKNIGSLFDSQKFCDVTFNVNGTKFRAHKLILSSRCQYFESMFSKWEETNQPEIELKDIDPSTFNTVLEFLYKGELLNWKEKMEDNVINIMKAADMYGISGLRKKCERFIIREGKISLDTACDFFILGDIHNAGEVKSASIKFIAENLKEIKQTAGYVKLKRHNTSPADLFEQLSPTKRQKQHQSRSENFGACTYTFFTGPPARSNLS